MIPFKCIIHYRTYTMTYIIIYTNTYKTKYVSMLFLCIIPGGYRVYKHFNVQVQQNWIEQDPNLSNHTELILVYWKNTETFKKVFLLLLEGKYNSTYYIGAIAF